MWLCLLWHGLGLIVVVWGCRSCVQVCNGAGTCIVGSSVNGTCSCSTAQVRTMYSSHFWIFYDIAHVAP